MAGRIAGKIGFGLDDAAGGYAFLAIAYENAAEQRSRQRPVSTGKSAGSSRANFMQQRSALLPLVALCVSSSVGAASHFERFATR